MLGSVLNTIHNLHYYLNLMSEIRQAMDENRLSAWVSQFKTDRARGV
jgi:queuine tRNA-ribosyltransferase